ncbi:hypothetical protein ONZ45_g6722 [Pleurotus djamor]|nr:hypothetical protein ONZ45_g6722 [Pleurotus djamor]
MYRTIVTGPLVLVALLYESIGIVMAWIVKQFYWTPHRFRYGILVAGGWGNYGDIPTSVVMSITGSAPFIASTDQALSVAYMSAFILVFAITLFPCGGHQLIAKDYIGPEVEDEEVQHELRQKHRRWLNFALHPVRKVRDRSGEISYDIESPVNEKHPENEKVAGTTVVPVTSAAEDLHLKNRSKHVSFRDGEASDACKPQTNPPDWATGCQSLVTSPAPTVVDAPLDPTHTGEERPSKSLTPATPPAVSVGITSETSSILRYRRRSIIYKHFITFIQSLCTPVSLAIILSFPIAVVPQLKGLFVDVPGAGIPPAPDGQPPLAFIIDTATFIGAASVPLGLICLGSALARLKIPRNQWSSLPIGAITSLAFARLLIMPVLGVLICQGLVSVGVIRAEDKVLRFVCIFFSCLPTATTQVFLTQVYSGTGTAEHLSAFLIPQYIIMFVSITGLTAYTLQMLF